jgi:hypothetical protein
MTAIVWTHIPEGFAIGADGRRRDSNSGQVESDKVQKIYSVRVRDLRLVYAWSGTTCIQRLDGVAFDFKFATDSILQSTDVSGVRSFSDFVAGFVDALYSQLLFHIGIAVRIFDKREIARLLFLTHFRGSPCVAEIFVEHDGTVVLRPSVKCPAVTNRFDIFTGSKKAYEELKSKLDIAPGSLTEAAALVREYIAHCMRYQDVDSDCANIGGHIHTGIFKPTGFSWIDAPLPRRRHF